MVAIDAWLRGSGSTIDCFWFAGKVFMGADVSLFSLVLMEGMIRVPETPFPAGACCKEERFPLLEGIALKKVVCPMGR